MSIVCRYCNTALVWQEYGVSLGLDCLVGALLDSGSYCRSCTV